MFTCSGTDFLLYRSILIYGLFLFFRVRSFDLISSLSFNSVHSLYSPVCIDMLSVSAYTVFMRMYSIYLVVVCVCVCVHRAPRSTKTESTQSKYNVKSGSFNLASTKYKRNKFILCSSSLIHAERHRNTHAECRTLI